MYLYQYVFFTENEVKDKCNLLELMIRDKNGFTPFQYGVKSQTTSNDIKVIFLMKLSS